MAAPNIAGMTSLKGKTDVQALGTSATAITSNTASLGLSYKINAITISNITSSDATVSVDITKGISTYHVIKDVTVPANSTLNLTTRETGFYLQEGESIRLTGSAADTLEAICSYEIIEGPAGVVTPQIEATGGTITQVTEGGIDYKVHTFTSSGTFEVTSGSGDVDLLLVGGGGGGGENTGGGGGAGGVVSTNLQSINVNTYQIVVGSGGSGAILNSDVNGSNGSESSAFDLTAFGGGGGGTQGNAGLQGGSGGGGSWNSSAGGQGVVNQGNDGGNGETGTGSNCSGDGYNAGGGGGAGSKGENATLLKAGNGGVGLESSISGTSVYYAGGGGGGADSNRGSTNGIGGTGGGGSGAVFPFCTSSQGDVISQNGENNTGGGGGGATNEGSSSYLNGGNGGSGIVIIRYPYTPPFLLEEYPNAAAAYSLRALTSDAGSVVRVRRSIDDTEADFTADQVSDGTLVDFVTGSDVKAADHGTGAAAAYSLRSVSDSYTGPVVRVRRSIDDAEEDFTAQEVSDGTLKDFATGSDIKAADHGAGAAAAFSLRNVVSAYSGPVVRVRRSSDDTERDFTATEVEDGTLTSFVTGIPNIRPADYGDGAAAAYSLRYVSDSYTGPVIRVRRSSDNTERDFTPEEINDGRLESFCGSGNGLVTTWYDQSGNGHDAVQSSTSLQPQIVSSGTLIRENGLPSVYADGSSQMQTSQSLSINQSLSVFAAARSNSSPNDMLITMWKASTNGPRNFIMSYDGATNGWRFIARSDVGNNFPAYTQQDDLNNFVLITGIFDSNNVSAHRNSILTETVSFTDTTIGEGSQPLSIFNFETGSLGNDPFIGYLSEAIVYFSDQSENRESIETEINSHYSIYTTGDDGFVTTWYDQSGNSNDAVQTTTGSQPKIVDSGGLVTENGKAALSFDGVNDNLKCAQFGSPIAQPSTHFAIAQHNTPTNSDFYFIFDSADVSNRQIIGQNANVWFLFGGNNLLSSTNPTTNQALHTGVFNSTSSFYYLNSTNIASGDPGAESLDGVTIGSRYDGAEHFWNGNIQELVLYDSDQSSNRTVIEADINSYYNIYSANYDGFVTTWYDQSGNSNDATQATTSEQPRIVSAGSLVTENGRAAVNFGYDGSKTYLDINTLSLSQPLSVFSVYNATNDSAQPVGNVNGSSASTDIAFGRRFSGSHYMVSGILLDSGTHGDDYKMASIIFDSPSSSGYWNGQLLISGDTGNNDAINEIGGTGGTGSPNLLIGNIGEVIIYNSDESSNRTAIEADINSYYNIYSANYDGFVTTWYDQSGNGNDAVQTTTGSQPKIVSAGSLIVENGQPAIDFDGVDDNLVHNLTISQPFSALSVYTAIEDNSFAFGGESASVGATSGARFDGSYVMFAGNVQSSGTHGRNRKLSFSMFDGANSIGYWNSQQFTSGNVGSNTNVKQIGGNGGDLMTGKIQELMFYNSDQSANRTAIEDNINYHYGIY